MKNVKKIRSEKKAGNFFSASTKILLDNKLTDGSLRLLINILNDSDDFNISETVYCNRLNITKKTFHNRMQNLEEAGYIKRTEIDGKVAPINGKEGKKANSTKKMYFYTVCEYGNLNTKTEKIIINNKIENDMNSLEQIKKNYWDSSFGQEVKNSIIQEISVFSSGSKKDISKNIKIRINNKMNEKFQEICNYLEEGKKNIAEEEAKETVNDKNWIFKTIKQSIEIESKK
jgi:DNA-binding Lrp family transcriptional regulator